MPLFATRGPYALKISYDDDPPDPRADCDNFGTMCCWHRRYNLGDEHTHENPEAMMAALVKEAIPDKQLIEYVKNGKVPDLRLTYSDDDQGWRLESYSDHFKQWFEEYFVDRPLSYEYECIMADYIRENMPMRTLTELAACGNLILPLFLYDHSGITMSTGPFSCPWDSGPIGYIYTSYADVQKEYGEINKDTVGKAIDMLKSEVECYDYYLTGQCFGYEFYKEGTEVDACWGYLGDLQDLQKEIEDWLPDDCKGITEKMDETQEPIDLSEYWERPENEKDQDDEWEDER